MKKILLFAVLSCIGVFSADAVVRTENVTTRTGTGNTTQSKTKIARTTTRGAASGTVVSRTATNTNTRTNNRAITTRTTNATRPSTTTARTATIQRTDISRTANIPTRGTSTVRTTSSGRQSRAATRSALVPTTSAGAFGSGYNACRDAYFTCMDQFCATANDTYRRCICSSRLTDIQSRERALAQTSDQLQDFKNLNIDAISKTAAEVNAMLTETDGEAVAANANDKSDSAKQLAGISAVLTGTKKQSMSTLGTLDIAGDINAIWATTDLASGANIANLTGEPLYNAVHSQCVEMVKNNCSSNAILDMVVSAYGMYIENDCSLLVTALDKQKTAADGTIRDTEREMNLARLENYDAHNSSSINDCIAQVRIDITADTACGPDYVHCLDVTGRYLNYTTGEPIYTPDFYQLASQISLSGDVLTNPTNRSIVADLERKREFAARGLDTCRDLSDEVWDEFMRQAIAEIYQGQQERIRQVKTECLDVVNTCYDEQTKSLKDFSNIKEQLLLGSRLELSEELCREQLQTCSNLYGDGKGNGMDLLLTAMHDLTDQKIGQQCYATLLDYTKQLCAVPGNDTLHTYPYGCRTYVPSTALYATNPICNALSISKISESDKNDWSQFATDAMRPNFQYACPTQKTYNSCNANYFLYNDKCYKCPDGYRCTGGESKPVLLTSKTEDECGDYPGSLYQTIVRYATQVCVRPSDAEQDGYILPTNILADVNSVMDSVRSTMASELAKECERLGGEWVSDKYPTKTSPTLFKYFYEQTAAETDWGYCKEKEYGASLDRVNLSPQNGEVTQ